MDQNCEELYKHPAFVLTPWFIVYYIYVCMYVTIYRMDGWMFELFIDAQPQ